MFKPRRSSAAPLEDTSGSSGSFSRVSIGGRLLEPGAGREVDESLGLDTIRRAPALVRAAKELELLLAGAALREARAVLADTEEVGGLETRMDRRGDSNVA